MMALAAYRRGFTIFELLVVLAILAMVTGMSLSLLGPRAIRGTQVRTAAEQLVSVLRMTRQMAMDHKSVYGVTFNIQNAPGSTGQVLNNRSGGHWYRIIGPSKSYLAGWTGIGNYSYPDRFDRGALGGPNPGGPDAELGGWLNAVAGDFIGEKYVLPKGNVRFLALTDEDNGNNHGPSYHFGETYPRPWFGMYWQASWDSKPRLYPWGGYDPVIKDIPQQYVWYAGGNSPRISPITHNTIGTSGFYYEGDEGVITGCCNPSDRMIIDDPKGAGPGAQANYRLFKAGEPRPLVNGNWLDCVILFMPDGTAHMDDWMNMRHQYGSTGHENKDYSYYNDLDHNNLAQLGPGDMCNFINGWEIGNAPVPYNNTTEASNYADRTGTYYITMAGDAPDDTVSFASAQEALTSLLPMYRVGVTTAGEVKMLEVKTVQPADVTLDPTWQGSYWEGQSSGYIGYYNNELTLPSGPCFPVEDFVTTTMLAKRQWWISPPAPTGTGP